MGRTIKMKLSDYVAERLSREVKHAFVGTGGSVVHILDSLAGRPDVAVVPCENEQGAAIAAEAYSRVTKNLGVAVATSGPGVVNLLQGIACAYYDSIPALFISGQPPTSQLKGARKARQIGFQEMDAVGMVSSMTKYAVLITDPSRIRCELDKLIHLAKEGRPGPVLLDLPDDIQRAEVDPKTLEGFRPPRARKARVAPGLRRLKELVAGARRPLIIAGGGIKLSGTEMAARKFIRTSSIPVVTTWATIDMFETDFPGLVGNFGISATRAGNFAVQTADLVISLGSRLDTHQTGSNPAAFAPKAKKVVIDIDREELDKNNGMPIDVKIECDLREFFGAVKGTDLKARGLYPWKERVRMWRERYPICPPGCREQKGSVNPYVFMDELSKAAGGGDIIITDAGATLTWTMQGYPIRRRQALFSAFNHSPMGYALPASIGAQFAAPESRVVCISGDGGMNMNIQELETLVFNRLPVRIFVLNNGEYGIIKQTQDTWLKSRHVASDPSGGLGFPDLVKISGAYGIKTVRISDHRDLADGIRRTLAYNRGPILCDVKVRAGERIQPKLVFGRPLEDSEPLLSREELEENLKI